MRNKKGNVAVTFLVFMSVAVAGAALFIFINSSRGAEERILDGRFIDNIYINESKVNFYIDNIIDAAVLKTLSEIVKEGSTLDSASADFQSNFKSKFKPIFLEELRKYKDEEGKYYASELSQVEDQASRDDFNAKVENGKVILGFKIMIVIKEGDGKFSAFYVYTKTFEKSIDLVDNEGEETADEEGPGPDSTINTQVASVNLAEASKIPGSNTVYDGYYIYFNGEKTGFFLIKTIFGYTVMKEGSGDYYALIEEDHDYRIVTYPDKPLPDYLKGKKFSIEGNIIYFKDK
jgi:hypothetical protein